MEMSYKHVILIYLFTRNRTNRLISRNVWVHEKEILSRRNNKYERETDFICYWMRTDNDIVNSKMSSENDEWDIFFGKVLITM